MPPQRKTPATEPDPPEEVSGNLRARQRAATRATIEERALDLFLQHGYDAVTTGDIAEAAGVSPRTFFRHFPDGKDGIMLAGTRRASEAVLEQLRRRPPQEPPFDALREAFRTVWGQGGNDRNAELHQAARLHGDIASGHPELLARLIGERHLLALNMVDLIALRLAADPRTDIRPQLLLQCVSAAMTAAWMSWLEQPGSDYRPIIEEAFELLANGLGEALVRHPDGRVAAHRANGPTVRPRATTRRETTTAGSRKSSRR